MFSPSATSPALSTLEDNDLFFRTSPSDARQGQVIAELLQEKGIKSIAMTYTNNDYGKASQMLSNRTTKQPAAKSQSTRPMRTAKETTREVAALSQAGVILMVVGYLDQGGKGIIQSSLDAGAFSNFFLPDAMIGESPSKPSALILMVLSVPCQELIPKALRSMLSWPRKMVLQQAPTLQRPTMQQRSHC